MYKKISGSLEYKFTTDKGGLHLIKIEAACQKRADLKVGIDEIKLREMPAKDKIQYWKIPPAWNGNELKGTSKIVVLIAELSSGEHILKFESKGEAELSAEPKINFFERKSLITVLENIQSLKKNRQPWITAVLINLPLNFLDISATCQKRFLDSDDLKLVIDGEIQKHPGSLWWGKNWLWQGRLSRGATQVKRIYKKLEKGVHYIELWADETPTLEKISFNLSSFNENGNQPTETVRSYEPGSNGEDYNKFDMEIKKWVDEWNNKFAMQKFPPLEPMDPNLVKAMIYAESRMGYGSLPTGHPVLPDIMQVADPRNPAIHTLNNDGWIDPVTGQKVGEREWINDRIEILDYRGEAKVDSADESIRWGTRWLYHKAQYILSEGGRSWKSWEQAVADYNQKDNWNYQKEVYKIYREGVDAIGQKLWTLAIGLLASAALVAGLFFYQSHQNKFYAYRKTLKGTHDFNFYVKTLDGLRWKKFFLGRYYDDGRNLDFFLDEKIFVNLWTSPNDGEKLIAVSGNDTANYHVTAMVSYKDGEFRIVPKVDEWGSLENTFNADQISIENLDDDPEEEIVENHFVYYDNADDQIWKEYYDFDRSAGIYKFIKETKAPIRQARTEKISEL